MNTSEDFAHGKDALWNEARSRQPCGDPWSLDGKTSWIHSFSQDGNQI